MTEPIEEEKPFRPYVRWDMVYLIKPIKTEVDWNSTLYNILAENVFEDLQTKTQNLVDSNQL